MFAPISCNKFRFYKEKCLEVSGDKVFLSQNHKILFELLLLGGFKVAKERWCLV
ncbi:hypothetical protein HHE02_17140 [Helicobacter heilmannii]|uniref:Uncharacterized protein n=1 Tax=Helicobacter heilmannii TaxID=35817 RepID=A0A0K2YBI5_HELHE|nr:hypothetical protein BN341_6000 [Helicobacter heilmannii ASB1.4]CRF45841.1 hypothetical protein HHE014_08190 [Helicobacter heilmannii]CRF48389.1 hypothetical protein HHE02_17140 [Helicobacter heilmannii]CRF49998.1 hypothetical protein HHE03_16910 [Helicobacter heilmannii]CRF51778.1 hypothetical protein HHE06_16820 [Helicobacter heilmannii]